MTDPDASVPTHGYRPATVGFIRHRLPNHHPFFVNPPVQYDPMSGRYVPDSRLNESVAVAPSTSPLPPDGTSLLPRPEWTSTETMGLWNDIFPEAMDRLRSTPEPRGRSKTDYDIRQRPDWNTVYDTLKAAQGKYLNETGQAGWLRKWRRKVGDNLAPVAGPAKIASKVVPSNPYTTPVLAAVEVVLDVRRAPGWAPDKVDGATHW
jgi:hypothetical protein